MARPENITGLISGYNKGFDGLNEAQRAFDTEKRLIPGQILWFDNAYGSSADGRRARALLQGATLEPDMLFRTPPQNVN